MSLLDHIRREGILGSAGILFKWKLWMPAAKQRHRKRCRDLEHRWPCDLSDESFQAMTTSQVDPAWYSPRFYLDKAQQESVACMLKAENPQAVEHCEARCREILAGDHAWLIEGWQNRGRLPDWHALIDSPGAWPSGPSESIDYMSEQRPGDIRRIWELNRHQSWIVLGRGWRLTGEDAIARGFVEQLKDWVARNPYRRGPNWTQAQEVALRAISWCWAWHLFHDAPAFDRDARHLMLKALSWHLRFVEAEMAAFGRHTHNHLISELAGIHLVSRFFPFLRGAAKLEARSRRNLSDEILKQIHPDGLAGELASNYMLFVLDTLAGVVAADREFWRDTPAWRRVAAMGRAAGYLIRPDGSLPFFGDNDSGRGWLLAEDLVDRSPYAQLPWVLENEALPHWAANSIAPEWHWLFGARTPDPEHQTRALSCLFRDGGIWTWRSSEHGDANWCLLRGGATRRLPGVLQSHHHADVLSIEVAWQGKAVIIDPGTWAYSLETDLRARFRSSRVHSGLWVDGHEACSFRGQRFGVWDLPTSEILDEERGLRMACCWGPVRHERRVVPQANSFLIEDRVTRPAAREAGIGFHLAPGLEVEPRASGWFLPGVDLSIRVEQADPAGAGFRSENGLASLRYGHKFPTTLVRVLLPAAAECVLSIRIEGGDTA